jgi:hypothetical protein
MISGLFEKYRADVEQYHLQRGTLYVDQHCAKAAKPQYEVPYYFEARRLEGTTVGLNARTVQTLAPTFFKALWIRIHGPTLWRRAKNWMRVYMPLTFDNLNLA